MSDDDLNVYIGKRIKQRRSEMGLTQEKLGKYLGITFQQLQKYEKGINKIRASMLYKLSNKLEVEYLYFFDGYKSDSIHSCDDYNSDHQAQKEAARLVKIYQKILFPEAKTVLINIAKEIQRLSENCTENL